MATTTEPQPRLAILIDLSELRKQMDEYVDSSGADIVQALTLSSFLIWLRNKQKENDNDG